MVGPGVTSPPLGAATSQIAIVIPCYNERATLGDVVERCQEFGTVLVIDDGSTDGSRDIALAAGAQVLRTAGRTGYDGAIEHGLQAAYDQGYQVIITIDADGEHDPACLASFVAAHARGIPLVIGVRPAPQRLAEWLVCFYCRRRFGINDILCGMKGYTRPVLQAYFASEKPNLVNTWPTLMWSAQGGAFEQIAVTGVPRTDTPRFQSLLRANLRIAGMLWPIAQLVIHK
ncbi:MAG: glycosyltransferase family 2 protein [Colwellia sp.]|nr:glycosyltransferase family 2 protein [Colwellia sp.]